MNAMQSGEALQWDLRCCGTGSDFVIKAPYSVNLISTDSSFLASKTHACALIWIPKLEPF